MFPYLAKILSPAWGPFRLLGSRLVLLALGTYICAMLTWYLLPKLWKYMPVDRGKVVVAQGELSKGKPTGAGMIFVPISLLVTLLVIPFTPGVLLLLACLGLMMLTGYLDDRASNPWPESVKMACDLLVCGVVACIFFNEQDGMVWLPVFKGGGEGGSWMLPPYWYVPCATFVLLCSVNVVNCSDGVDGVAGSLSLFSLVGIALFLYMVLGHSVVADYLLLPHISKGATWATVILTSAGGLAAYLWYNASPSIIMMGDAGSRFIGLLIGIAVILTGNPLMLLAFAPIICVNGGCGLAKLIVLRVMKRLGFDTRMPLRNITYQPVHPENFASDEEADRQVWLVRLLHRYRFPIHDHCRKKLMWSDTQVLVRFMLLQAVLMPVLILIFIKLR